CLAVGAGEGFALAVLAEVAVVADFGALLGVVLLGAGYGLHHVPAHGHTGTPPGQAARVTSHSARALAGMLQSRPVLVPLSRCSRSARRMVTGLTPARSAACCTVRVERGPSRFSHASSVALAIPVSQSRSRYTSGWSRWATL